MAKIHVPGDGHVAPLPTATASGTIVRWEAFSNAKRKKVVTDALHILRHNIRGAKPCNDCFSNLPNGRTFDDVLDDPAIFISFDSSNDGSLYGATLGNDITVCNYSIRMGRWTVAATLVHELAHVNGAPTTDHQAEGTLLCCGLTALHDATIIGGLESPSDSRLA